MDDTIELGVLADSFAEMLGAEWPREKAVARARGTAEPFEAALWSAMAGLGWTALTVPEANGGLGMGVDAALRLHMALGAAVAPVPMLGTTLATVLLDAVGGDDHGEMLGGLADGSVRVAFAAPDSVAIAADGHVVEGVSHDLLDALSATHLFLRATRDGSSGWLIIDADAPGVSIEAFDLVDATRTLGSVTLSGVEIAKTAFIAADAVAEAAVTRAAMLAIAGDAQGGGEAVLAATIDYMKGRIQFGVPIGSFQALKHRVADHHTALAASRELLEQAAALPPDHPEALLYAVSAKQHATRMTAEIARDCIQLHGGVGFTAEYVPHLYLKRAKVNECLWGTRAETLDRVADLLAATSEAPAAAQGSTRTFDILGRVGDEQAFRQEIRDWLAVALDPAWRGKWQSVRESELRELIVGWLEERRKVGLAAPHWPKAWGGPGLPFAYQIMVYEELCRADAPELDMFTISLFHTPATLFEHGTQAQKDTYLSGVVDGTDIWVQGFSEPGSGSDLASLRTSAVRDGDHYVVNGQKIWSSGGMNARYCLLLARTDPNGKRKHDGISYFILDMQSPGVEVRPIRQITGEAEFCEIFLDDVRIPAENLIGAEGNGWMIAQSTLSTERGLLIFGAVERLARSFALDGQDAAQTWMQDAQFRREYAQYWAELQTIRLMIRKLLIELEANPDKASPTLPTFIKLTFGPFLQRYTEFLLRAEGMATMKWQPAIPGTGHSSRLRFNDFLKSYGWTIAGGSNEIMRNIVSERILGMPRG